MPVTDFATSFWRVSQPAMTCQSSSTSNSQRALEDVIFFRSRGFLIHLPRVLRDWLMIQSRQVRHTVEEFEYRGYFGAVVPKKP
jgi:hypothetical protein